MANQTLLYQLGTLLAGRFELRQVLGQGAAGVVYEAIDREIANQRVAVKVLYPHLTTRPEMVDRLRNEVRIARELSHAHIVKIHEWGSDGAARHFLVMEHVRGVSLRALLDGQPNSRLPLGDTVRILYEIADAVSAAHQAGVVHRDLKPDNVIVDESGHVKVLDFGVARIIEDDRGLTQTGESIGTPWYMSPEQFRGDDACAQSDIYSFGVLAYELLSGIKPFEDQVYYRLALRHLNDELPAFPSDVQVPDWYQAMVREATEKDRATRTASMELIADLLAGQLDEAVLLGHRQLVRSWRAAEYARSRRARRRSWRVSGEWIALTLMLLLIGYWVFCMVNQRQWTIAGKALIQLELLIGNAPVAPFKTMFGLRIPVADDHALASVIREFMDQVANDDKSRKSSFIAARAEMLLSAGVGTNSILPMTGLNVLEHFVRYGPPNFVRPILQHGGDPNLRSADGTPVAHLAIELQRQDELMDFFTHPGFDPLLTDPKGNTAMHIAARSANNMALAALDYILSGSEMNGKNVDGDTVLHILARTGIASQPGNIASLGMQEGIDIEIRNNSGYTPLELAIVYDQPGNVEAFLKLNQVKGSFTKEKAARLRELAKARNNLAIDEMLDRFLAPFETAAT